MLRFLLGFLVAILLMATLYTVFSYQLLSPPIPLNANQFTLERDKTLKDSHAKWTVLERREDSYIIELRYPLKRYVFSVKAANVTFEPELTALPRTVDARAIRIRNEAVINR